MTIHDLARPAAPHRTPAHALRGLVGNHLVRRTYEIEDEFF